MRTQVSSSNSSRDLESNETSVKRTKRNLIFSPLEWWRSLCQSGIVKTQQECRIHWTRVQIKQSEEFDEWLFRPSGIQARRSWSWRNCDSPKGSFGLFLVHVFGIARFQGFKNYPDLSAQELQCCFICLKCTEGYRAVRVPCVRPTEIRSVPKRVTNMKRGKKHQEYNKSNSGEGGIECDSAIFSRMREMLYRYLGTWKARLPYYGVLDAYEIEVSSFDSKLDICVANSYIVPDRRMHIAK